MSTHIKCPHCANEFDVQDVLSADVEQKIKQHYEQQHQQLVSRINADKKKLEEEQKLFEEKRKKENELFQQKLQQEKLKLEAELQQQLRKSIAQDYENQLRLLQQNNTDNEEKLKAARQKELDFLKKEQELKNKEQELEIQIQKKLLEERNVLTQQIRKEENERNNLKETEYQLKMRELEKQLEDQRKLAEEMKRKAEQGSMQLQGEVQELALQDMLKAAFPFDVVCEVGKGVKGADCILTIRNNVGLECGKIIFESKRTKDFGVDWIEKLKADMRAEGADLGVIVTQTMPRGMDKFGERDGIWVCNFLEAKALVHVLRDGVLRVFNATKRYENRGDKMHLLYDYLTSNEFAEQWKAVREGFLSMKLSIQKEKDAMEKLWKAREKHLEKILLNTAHIKGSIEGIAGQDTIDLTFDSEEIEEDDSKLLFK
jgi:hypothetical protein